MIVTQNDEGQFFVAKLGFDAVPILHAEIQAGQDQTIKVFTRFYETTVIQDMTGYDLLKQHLVKPEKPDVPKIAEIRSVMDEVEDQVQAAMEAEAEQLETTQPLSLEDSVTLMRAKPEFQEKLGTHVKDQGIYFGIWHPKDEDGKSLGKIFDLYAAPTDLQKKKSKRLLLTFNQAITKIADLKDWHGHNGILVNSYSELLDLAQENPEILTNWFMPSQNLLSGQPGINIELQEDCIWKYQKKFPLGSGFADVQFSDIFGLIANRWASDYFCLLDGGEYKAGLVSFGQQDICSVYLALNKIKASTRPVRAVERKLDI